MRFQLLYVYCSVPSDSLPSRFTLHQQVLGHQVSDEHLPDVSLIGEMGDVTELGKLVQLVLGCAVSCEKKQGKAACGKRENPVENNTQINSSQTTRFWF